MAHLTHKNTWNEQLWNVSLLPAPAPRRAVERAGGPNSEDDGSALRSAALLSVFDAEVAPRLAQAA
jgi:hypothetical protein